MNRRMAIFQEIYGFITLRGTVSYRQVHRFLLKAYGFREKTAIQYLKDMKRMGLVQVVRPGWYRALPFKRGLAR